jgi:class 3 adenylate cyclase
MGGVERLQLGRRTTVLYAGMRSAEERAAAPRAPEEAKAVARCLQVLGQAPGMSGGRVVRTWDTAVMALFPTADAAAASAARMHACAQTLPPARGRLGLRIGIHSGPVAQANDEIFGDTVEVALQLADQAKNGQAVTSHETASHLSPAIQESVRELHLMRMTGKAREVLLEELGWRRVLSHMLATGSFGVPLPRSSLQLNYRGARLLRRREGDLVTMGREPGCDVLVRESRASRHHCTIERREGKFVLRDHSTNGTFVFTEREGELHVQGQELPLVSRGWIALGQSGDATDEVVHYICN